MVTFMTALNYFANKITKFGHQLVNIILSFYLLVATGATDARDVTDSPLISAESRSAVQNPGEEQGTGTLYAQHKISWQFTVI